MASEVDICNLALAHLGDAATVASLDPPEGSAQAEHCARFYPVARDALLELHSWNFATRRALLAELASPWPQWAHAYALPGDCLRVLAVVDQTTATDDAPPADYVREVADDGGDLLLTNQSDAMVRYIAHVTDTTKFSPLFTTTLAWHLAGLLAGPLLKGDVGRAETKRCEQMAAAWLGKATTSDANQRRLNPTHTPGWISSR